MKRPLASALLVMALLALTVSSARAVPSIQAAIRLSPSFGPPTTLTKVQGSGFQAGETVDLTFDSDPVGQVVANARGRFATTVTMPASALPGAHLITATGESSGLQAQASFTVRTDWTKFHFDLPNTGENPFENVLSASTVGGLTMAWSAPTAGDVESSPAVVGGIVYAAGSPEPRSSLAVVYAFDAATGKPVWTQSTGGQDTSSVTVWGGTVYVGTLFDHTLHTFDAATGDPGWSFHTSGAVGTPVVDRGRVFFSTNSGPVYAVDARTGTQIWKKAVGDFGARAPAIAGGLVCVGTDYTQRVTCLDEATGTQVWKRSLGADVLSSPAISGGVLYIGDNGGTLHALKAATGQAMWTATTGGAVESSPAVADGAVFVGSDDHNVYSFDAATGKQRWVAPTGDAIQLGSPSVANGVVYSGSEDHSIYAFDEATGEQLWTFATGDLINTSPAIADGVLYIGSFDDHVYAFHLPP